MRKGALIQPSPERPLGHHLKSREQDKFRKNTGIIPTQHCPELGSPSEAYTTKSVLPRHFHSTLPTGVLLCLTPVPTRSQESNRRQNKGLMPYHAASLTCACENLHFPCLPQLDSHVLQHPLYLVTGTGQGVVLHIPGSPQLRSDF